MRRALGRLMASFVLVSATARCGGEAFTAGGDDAALGKDRSAVDAAGASALVGDSGIADTGRPADAALGMDVLTIDDADRIGREGGRRFDAGSEDDATAHDAEGPDAGSFTDAEVRDRGEDAALPEAGADAGCDSLCGAVCCMSTQHCCPTLVRVGVAPADPGYCESLNLACSPVLRLPSQPLN
jgi:hypothetical protein